VKNILIARRYSLAVFKSIKNNDYNSYLQDIVAIRSLFNENKSLSKETDSYLISIDKKIAFADSIAAELQNKDIWKNLFDLLIERHKFSIILIIINDLEHLILDASNTTKVILKVAHQQSGETIENIKSQIKKILKKEVILDIKIKPEIIGGFIAETESMQIDGSVKNNLEKFKQNFIK